jgi:hypothetical protein
LNFDPLDIVLELYTAVSLDDNAGFDADCRRRMIIGPQNRPFWAGLAVAL